MRNDFLIIFTIFYFLFFGIIFVKQEQLQKKEFSPFENAAEVKTKIWYDPQTKTELAAHSIVTKSYKKILWWRKIIDEGWDYNIEFTVPLKLADGDIVFNTTQLPYYIK